MSLADKIRKARETTVEINGGVWTIRRPTDEEAVSLSANGDGLLAIVKRFVIDWPLKEIDLVPGGTDVKPQFDAEAFAEWVADKPDLWEPLGSAVLAAYKTHADKRDETVKN